MAQIHQNHKNRELTTRQVQELILERRRDKITYRQGYTVNQLLKQINSYKPRKTR